MKDTEQDLRDYIDHLKSSKNTWYFANTCFGIITASVLYMLYKFIVVSKLVAENCPI